MTEQNAQKPSLSALYRRFAGSQVPRPLPNAADVLELARVAHAEDAASPLHADLLRFSRALEPESARLSADIQATFDAAAPGTHRRSPAVRHAAAGGRRRGALVAIAASLLAVVGVWTLQQGRAPHTLPTQAAVTNGIVTDRIFAALDSRAASVPDEIFRDQFSARPDVIFRSHDG